MEKQQFEIILNKINGITIMASEVKELNISELVDLDNNAWSQLINKVTTIKTNMDKLNNDFYHLVGSTALSGKQLLQLAKSVKKVLSYRNFIEKILSAQPHIKALRSFKKTETQYKLSFLDVTLKYDLEGK